MENPKSVHRFLLTLLAVCTVAALGFSIYYRSFYIFLGWLAAVVLFFVGCGVLALFNVAMFAPIFWLMSRLPDSKAMGRKKSSDSRNNFN